MVQVQLVNHNSDHTDMSVTFELQALCNDKLHLSLIKFYLCIVSTSFLLLVVRPGAPSSVLAPRLLVAMPFAPSSYLQCLMIYLIKVQLSIGGHENHQRNKCQCHQALQESLMIEKN